MLSPTHQDLITHGQMERVIDGLLALIFLGGSVAVAIWVLVSMVRHSRAVDRFIGTQDAEISRLQTNQVKSGKKKS